VRYNEPIDRQTDRQPEGKEGEKAATSNYLNVRTERNSYGR
jgi:hypothetical protein